MDATKTRGNIDEWRAFGGIRGPAFFEEIAEWLRDQSGVKDGSLTGEDLLYHGELPFDGGAELVMEGVAGEQLSCHDAKRIDVIPLVVLLLEEDLGGDDVDGAKDGLGHGVVLHDGEPKVGDLGDA